MPAPRNTSDWSDLIFYAFVALMALGGWIAKKIKQSREAREADVHPKRAETSSPPQAARPTPPPPTPAQPAHQEEEDELVIPQFVIIEEGGRTHKVRLPALPPQARERPVRPARRAADRPKTGKAARQKKETQTAPAEEAAKIAKHAERVSSIEGRHLKGRLAVTGDVVKETKRARYTASDMRHAIVLSEILRPPLALRNDQSLFDPPA